MMDPLTALLFSLWIAGYFTKNVTQDLAWRARGEDPPSFRRERERWDSPGRRLFANAWADAVASADERRARLAAKSAAKRRAKWSQEDLAAAEDEAYAINERVKATEPTDTTGQETRRCDRCGKHISREEVRGRIPVLLGIVVRVCSDCSADIDRENVDAELDPFAGDREALRETKPCHFCRREIPAAELWPTRAEDDTPVDACPPCWDDHSTKPGPTGEPEQQPEPDAMTQCAQCSNDVRVRDTSPIWVDGACLLVCPPCRLRRAEPDTTDDGDDESSPEPAPRPSGGAEIIQFADWQRTAASDTEKENALSAEITGLRSALAYAKSGVAAATQAAAQTEVAIAALQSGGTTGAAIGHLTAAMEGHHANTSHYTTAGTELTKQLQVTEAYEAHRDAGEREFVTND